MSPQEIYKILSSPKLDKVLALTKSFVDSPQYTDAWRAIPKDPAFALQYAFWRGALAGLSETKDEFFGCAYCGADYPKGTPSHGEGVSVLTDHIKVCPKHPMRKLEADKAKLRAALIELRRCYGKLANAPEAREVNNAIKVYYETA